ncbi:excisionase family DNA binding protein [Roseateles toxinivorans]|uniref:Excisionase family DNA binding protein n=2 Tax=Roseateles toxinivorans TaxID=270368 RepID=A0A4R6QRM8_9BURK|nr:excisionase family DNA binding protein [Roseateles toxinivorans]
MRKSAANDDVMSTRDAAERLGVALRTVQLWVESGVLPAWKTAGGHRRIAKSAVEKLLEERRMAISGEVAKPDVPQPFRILVVEDEPDLLRLFTMVIEDWGLPVALRTATNGFEALVRIGEQCPDLLITDLNMPGMDGFRMIRSLRNFGEGLETLEIVAVTALGPQDIENRGGLPDGVKVFIKPVPFAELEQLVRERVPTALASTPAVG